MKLSNPKISVFILAAGGGERWNNHLGIPKQLIRFGGETLIERTVRLAKQVFPGSQIYLVSSNHELKTPGTFFLKPENSITTSQTLLSTRENWEDLNIILLGDVFYSRASFEKIKRSNAKLNFWGRAGKSPFRKKVLGEIYAAHFHGSQTVHIREKLDDVIQKSKEGLFGNLWDLYHLMANLPFNTGQTENRLFQSVLDFTEDFDRPSDYESTKGLYNILAGGNKTRRILLQVKHRFLGICHFLFKKRNFHYTSNDWKFANS